MVTADLWWEAGSRLAGYEVAEGGPGPLELAFLVPQFVGEGILVVELLHDRRLAWRTFAKLSKRRGLLYVVRHGCEGTESILQKLG